jgi:hypothetical protein
MPDKVIYTVGGTVQASGGTYISREADEELLRLCRASEFCYVLTARQMGKSSLMVATMERLAAEGFHSVEIDLTQIGTELSGLKAEQWYLGLIEFIVDQLDLDVDYVAWWDERARLGPIQRLSQFLRRVVLERVSEPVLIFIDEIDSTLKLDFTDDFFAAIRACYNARASDPAFKRLSFVLLGVATPGDLISDPQRTPFNIGRRMDLTDFTERQAIPLADGLGLPPVEAGQVLTWILEWTGGHPYLTQSLCAAAAASPTKSWDAAVVDNLVEETFLGEQSAQDSNLQFVRDMLTQRAPDKAAVLKTYRRIRAGKAVPDEERSLAKTHLKLSGIVKLKGDYLVVRSRIYKQVFNQEWISQSTLRDYKLVPPLFTIGALSQAFINIGLAVSTILLVFALALWYQYIYPETIVGTQIITPEGIGYSVRYPEWIGIGDTEQFRISLTNEGTQSLSNVRVYLNFSDAATVVPPPGYSLTADVGPLPEKYTWAHKIEFCPEKVNGTEIVQADLLIASDELGERLLDTYAFKVIDVPYMENLRGPKNLIRWFLQGVGALAVAFLTALVISWARRIASSIGKG